MTSFVFLQCNPQPDLLEGSLDTEEIRDVSLLNPENYLVSAKYPSPHDSLKSKPVLIAVHGFTASTFEWDELRTYMEETGNTNSVLLSQVLLGGHGRSYS